MFFGGVGSAAAQSPNATMIVDSTGDQDDDDLSDGVCRTSSNDCTLRAAISQANNNPGSDTIHFNIPGGGLERINLGSPLPSMVDLSGGTTIDGYTEPGSSPNTSALTFNATILIEIEAPNGQNGFTIESPENEIRGLAIYDGNHQIELINENADGNVIVGNIIGSTVDFDFEQSSGIGVAMNLGPDQNTVGTPALEDRNVISGNGGQGIRINHGESSQNIIQNNIIGLDGTGTQSLRQSIGIDLQFWTWGNLVGGDGPNEGNLLSGNSSGGMDFSHSSTGNSVIGNRIGTFPDGNSANFTTGNGNGVLIKDNPVNNYVARNIISGNDSDGVWHKHNYSGRNIFVDNKIGVGGDGSPVGNTDFGVYVTGHDDIYFNNIIANNGDGGVNINNTTTRNNANYPDQLTERNAFQLGSMYNNGGPFIEIEGTDEHPNRDTPTITGIADGAVFGGETCPGCTVDIYGSGSINGDGTVSAGPTSGTHIRLVAVHSNLCIDVQNNSTSNNARILQGECDGDGGQQLDMIPDGDGFALQVAQSGRCIEVGGGSNSDGADLVQQTCDGADHQTLRWSGNSLVFKHSGLCLDIESNSTSNQADAEQDDCDGSDSQRFHFRDSIASTWLGSVTADGSGNFSMASSDIQTGMVVWSVSTTSSGETSEPSGHVIVGSSAWNTSGTAGSPDAVPSPPAALPLPPPYQPNIFECSANDGTLTWTDAGASAYYVHATTDGAETYLGGHTGTSLGVAGADSYRVTHWLGGFATRATCDGPGPDVVVPFSCSASGGVLSWDDAGADAYYVHATTNGTETYIGGFTGTSQTVAGADSYRVTHWLSGQTTATCDGPGPDPAPTFDCSATGGVLTWDDAGASEYFVRSFTNGVETYLGGFTGTSLDVAGADSYQVTHWLSGQTTATCDGPGPDPAPTFDCSATGGVLTWDDAGASEYYVFAVVNGEDVYLGGHTGTTLDVIDADSYRVTHWLGGRTVATCDGPGA